MAEPHRYITGLSQTMIIAALLLLLAIVCTYSWVAYKVKTTVPKVDVTVPRDRK